MISHSNNSQRSENKLFVSISIVTCFNMHFLPLDTHFSNFPLLTINIPSCKTHFPAFFLLTINIPSCNTLSSWQFSKFSLSTIFFFLTICHFCDAQFWITCRENNEKKWCLKSIKCAHSHFTPLISTCMWHDSYDLSIHMWHDLYDSSIHMWHDSYDLSIHMWNAARPYESWKIFEGRPHRNAFSKLVHRQYKSFPPDRFLSGTNQQHNWVQK